MLKRRSRNCGHHAVSLLPVLVVMFVAATMIGCVSSFHIKKAITTTKSKDNVFFSNNIHQRHRDTEESGRQKGSISSSATSSRRAILHRGAAAVLAGTSMCTASSAAVAQSQPSLSQEYYTGLMSNSNSKAAPFDQVAFPALTPPFVHRATYKYSLGRGAWALEQLLAFANVTATIRMNVVTLSSSSNDSPSLWVHSPVYPTAEALRLLAEIPGTVNHIVLPCNALEHKAPMESFCKKFPHAQVWVSPGQYGPFGSCGRQYNSSTPVRMPYRVNGILGDVPPPWANEFDMATVYVDLPENAGPVSEVAFCHRPTRTLVTTDAVIWVPSEAPSIFGTYFDDQTMVSDYFWERSVLQSVFLPLRQQQRDGGYPGFQALENRLVRAPILRAFTDARAPNEIRQWVDTIAQWKFDRIVTSHFASPILATTGNFQSAFAYLYDDDSASSSMRDALPPISCQDWELLEGLNRFIKENKLGAPATFDYSKGCLK